VERGLPEQNNSEMDLFLLNVTSPLLEDFDKDVISSGEETSESTPPKKQKKQRIKLTKRKKNRKRINTEKKEKRTRKKKIPNDEERKKDNLMRVKTREQEKRALYEIHRKLFEYGFFASGEIAKRNIKFDRDFDSYRKVDGKQEQIIPILEKPEGSIIKQFSVESDNNSEGLSPELTSYDSGSVEDEDDSPLVLPEFDPDSEEESFNVDDFIINDSCSS
jgi:hypothetical protein